MVGILSLMVVSGLVLLLLVGVVSHVVDDDVVDDVVIYGRCELLLVSVWCLLVVDGDVVGADVIEGVWLRNVSVLVVARPLTATIPKEASGYRHHYCPAPKITAPQCRIDPGGYARGGVRQWSKRRQSRHPRIPVPVTMHWYRLPWVGSWKPLRCRDPRLSDPLASGYGDEVGVSCRHP